MWKLNFLVFTTLVLLHSIVFAAGEPAPIDLNSANSEMADDGSKRPDPTRTQNVDISPPPPAPTSIPIESTTHYPFHSGITPKTGLFIDLGNLHGDQPLSFLAGLNYMMPSQTNKHWEWGIDLISDGTGQMSLGQKYIFHPDEGIRPFFKYGAGLHVVPTQNLATFINFDNWQARVALGLEDWLRGARSCRAELELGAGPKHETIAVNLGYTFAW